MTTSITKPKLLLVAGLTPWPTTSGGAVRVFQTLKHLSADYAIHLVSVVESGQSSKALPEHSKKFCTEIVTFQKQPRKSHWSFFSRGVPYWFSEWYNPELAVIVKQMLEKHQISLVQIETTQLLYLAAKLPKNVISIGVAYDVQLVSFWRRLTETQNWQQKIGKLFLLAQVYWYELVFLPKLSQVVAVSDTDQALLKKLYGIQTTVVVPNGYEQSVAHKSRTKNTFTIGFIGSLSHTPNKTAVSYLLEELAPKLQDAIGTFEIVLAGDMSGLDHSAPQYKNVSVKQLGFVEDVVDFYQQIDVLVAPLFSGSGTRIKILESLAHGVPVVTTPIGAEGLVIEKNQSGILLASSLNDFIEQLAQIKKNPDFFTTSNMAISQTWQAIFKTYSAQLAKHTKKNQTPA